MSFTPGQHVVVDRSLKAIFVRELEAGRAIIRVGTDTRVVSAAILGEEE